MWESRVVPTLESRHFASLKIRTDPDGLYMLGTTSAGKRIIQELLEVELTGERVNGNMIGNSGADWLAVAGDGEVTLDIRVLIETDDGARVFLHLDGRANWAEQLGRGAIFSVVRFESGDERYAFVNGLRLVSKGAVGDGGAVTHEIFELL
jgi:hypothetical protein